MDDATKRVKKPGTTTTSSTHNQSNYHNDKSRVKKPVESEISEWKHKRFRNAEDEDEIEDSIDAIVQKRVPTPATSFRLQLKNTQKATPTNSPTGSDESNKKNSPVSSTSASAASTSASNAKKVDDSSKRSTSSTTKHHSSTASSSNGKHHSHSTSTTSTSKKIPPQTHQHKPTNTRVNKTSESESQNSDSEPNNTVDEFELNQKLRDQLQLLTKKLQDVESSITGDLDKERQGKTSELEQLREALAKYQEREREPPKPPQVDKKELDAMKEVVKRLSEENANFKRQTEALQTTNKELNNDIQDITSRQNQETIVYNKKITALEADIQQHMTENKELQAEVQRLRHYVGDLQNPSEELESLRSWKERAVQVLFREELLRAEKLKLLYDNQPNYSQDSQSNVPVIQSSANKDNDMPDNDNHQNDSPASSADHSQPEDPAGAAQMQRNISVETNNSPELEEQRQDNANNDEDQENIQHQNDDNHSQGQSQIISSFPPTRIETDEGEEDHDPDDARHAETDNDEGDDDARNLPTNQKESEQDEESEHNQQGERNERTEPDVDIPEKDPEDEDKDVPHCENNHNENEDRSSQVFVPNAEHHAGDTSIRSSQGPEIEVTSSPLFPSAKITSSQPEQKSPPRYEIKPSQVEIKPSQQLETKPSPQFQIKSSQPEAKSSPQFDIKPSQFEMKPSPFEMKPSPFEMKPSRDEAEQLEIQPSQQFEMETARFEIRLSQHSSQSDTKGFEIRPSPFENLHEIRLSQHETRSSQPELRLSQHEKSPLLEIKSSQHESKSPQSNDAEFNNDAVIMPSQVFSSPPKSTTAAALEATQDLLDHLMQGNTDDDDEESSEGSETRNQHEETKMTHTKRKCNFLTKSGILKRRKQIEEKILKSSPPEIREKNDDIIQSQPFPSPTS